MTCKYIGPWKLPQFMDKFVLKHSHIFIQVTTMNKHNLFQFKTHKSSAHTESIVETNM